MILVLPVEAILSRLARRAERAGRGNGARDGAAAGRACAAAFWDVEAVGSFDAIADMLGLGLLQLSLCDASACPRNTG